MPEGEEDDRLDGEELDDGIERSQHLACGVVEQVERVQRQRHAEVVDDGDVEVATGGAVEGHATVSDAEVEDAGDEDVGVVDV